jgi:polar amino acid transport system substrate-binding protein
MTRLLLRAFLILLLLSPLSTGRAETVLERIARTGNFQAGTRADSRPFGFRTGSGELAGFAVDLLNEIRGRLEVEQKRPVTLQLTEVTPANRLDLVAQHRIDIECGITTATWAREQTVDFSIPFFENGTRVLAPRSQFRSLDDLAGHRVGVVRSSTTADVVRQYLPSIELVDIGDMDEGFRLLTDGALDGLANIGIVLRSRLETSALKSRLVLLPRTGALAWESIGCILPQNDSSWRDLVNQVIADLLVGVTDYRGRWVDIYNRWFGPQGELYYPLDREVAQRLASGSFWLR